jgi:hypothetical protein
MKPWMDKAEEWDTAQQRATLWIMRRNDEKPKSTNISLNVVPGCLFNFFCYNHCSRGCRNTVQSVSHITELLAHTLAVCFSPLALQPQLGLGLPPWNSPFHFGILDFRHSVGLLGRVISTLQDLYMYTNTEKRARTQAHKHQTFMPWVGFEPMISAFRASADSACFRPLGYRDRPRCA